LPSVPEGKLPEGKSNRPAVPLEVAIFAERVRVLYQKALLSIPTSLVNAAILVAVMWRAFDHQVLAMWGAANAILSVGRLALVMVYQRRPRLPENARPWANAFVAGAVLNGGVWGLSALLFAEPDVLTYRVFVIFILGGLCAGSTSSASSYLAAFFAFNLPALVPATVVMLLSPDEVHLAMGATLALFGVAMASLARTGGASFEESVRLRLEANALRSEREALLARYRAASEASLDAFFLLESVRAIDTGELLDFACVDMNRRAEELLGVKVQDALGRLIGEVIPHARENQSFEKYGEVIRTRLPSQDDFEVKEGELAGRWMQRQIVPLADGVAVTERDITKAKEAEREIFASLKQKEILLKEVHHRVKNNLQMISSLFNLQAEFITDPAVLEIFRESQARVRAIATVHQRLYQSSDLSMVDASGYLRALVVDLRRTFTGHDLALDVSVDVEPVGIGIDLAIPFGLAVNELVTNSIKHAFPGRRRGAIRILGKKTDDGVLSISVADDGIGVPEGIDLRSAQTLGLQLVYMLTKQMKGDVVLHREGGTRFELRVRLRADQSLPPAMDAAAVNLK
jgi:PAS domain S-box-containing protein